MNNFLDQYGRGMSRINKFIDLVILSLLWVVTSLPVITLGATTASAYNAVIKVTRQSRGYMWREYLFTLKDNFLITLPAVPLILAAGAGLAYISYRLFPYRFNMFFGVYLVLSVLIFLMLILFSVHLFTASGRFNLSRKELAQTAFRMTLTSPLKNLLLLFVVLGLAWIDIVFWPLIVILPGLFFLFLTYLLEPMFHRFILYEEDLTEEVRDSDQEDKNTAASEEESRGKEN